MADSSGRGVAPGTTNSTPQHLNTDIESGNFNEKQEAPASAAHHSKAKPIEDDEEEEEEDNTPGGGRVIPEDQLQTDTRTGLTEAEVHIRRKKYGLNQMKEEKENMLLKFLGYFVGPIQFVMEVSDSTTFRDTFAPVMRPISGGISTWIAVQFECSIERHKMSHC